MRLAVGMADEVVVDLPGAQRQTRDLLVVDPGLGEHRVKARVLRQVGDRAGRLRQAQQRLGGHDHERALLGDARLAAEQVEVLGRGRGARDADVALGGQRQEALQARGGVLRARALVAVGQQQRQARGLAPLGQARDDELVDDHLGGVDEVAELRLPQHERLGRLLAVAVLEAHARQLRERAVVQLQRRQRLGQALDRADGLPGLGVVQDHVALAEGAALGVLSGQADGGALGEQRRERERLGVRPVDGDGRVLADRALRACAPAV